MKKFRVPPATGMPARPRRNLAIPVAADPAMQGEKHVTAAAMVRDATDALSDPVPAGKFLKLSQR